MFSSTGFAEWKKTETTASGHIFYVDFDRIRKDGEYLYYWELVSRSVKSKKTGIFSSISYVQVDCGILRYKILTAEYYSEQMGQGNPFGGNNTPNDEWNYANPNSTIEFVLNTVCNKWLRHSKQTYYFG